jgi:hypothetical protein
LIVEDLEENLDDYVNKLAKYCYTYVKENQENQQKVDRLLKRIYLMYSK